MLQQIASSLQDFVSVLHEHGPIILGWVAIAWVIHLINVCCQYRLNLLGIYPRRLPGLIGIVCSPWLHGNWGHLLINTIMFLMMAMMVLVQGMETFVGVTILIVLLSGFLVWAFARTALHIGASALIMGYWGYLIVASLHHPTVLNVAVSIVCLYYFSGMFANLVPTDKQVSWEGHVFGFVSGIATSFLYPLVAGWL